MYISEGYVRVTMKHHKMVSLTPDTAVIAEKMKQDGVNFSQWVRIGLREWSMGTDIATEARLRIRWSKAAYMLASTLHERALEIDPETTITIEEIVAKAMNQTSLEEF